MSKAQRIYFPSGWPAAEFEGALERLRNELPDEEHLANKVMATALCHPFEEVQRRGGTRAFVLKILEQEDPEALKRLGKGRTSRGKRGGSPRLPKEVLRRIQSGEIVQWPPGGPFLASRKALAAQNKVGGRKPRPRKLKDPETQAMVEGLLRLRKEGDQLLNELTHEEHQTFLEKLAKLEKLVKLDRRPPTMALEVKLTTDEVRKTRIFARSKRLYVDQKERAANARKGTRSKKEDEDEVLIPLVLHLKRDSGMTERGIVAHVNRRIDDDHKITDPTDPNENTVEMDHHITRKRVHRILFGPAQNIGSPLS